jgi:hypothetical protein
MYGVFEIFWKIRGRTGSRRYLRNMNLFILKIKIKIKTQSEAFRCFQVDVLRGQVLGV